MIESAWEVLTQLAPWLLLGAAIAGLMHALLPPGWLERRLTGRGGVARAVLFGVPLPLCSCGVIPTGLGLKKQGASSGSTVAFLISTPQTGVDSVLVTAAVLGWPFALFKLVVAAVTGLAGGWLADAAEATSGEAIAPQAPTPGERANGARATIDHAIELIRSIWKWIVIGVLISAALKAWLPEQSLAALGAYGGLGAMLAALAVSLPLYVCATASVPIAASLVGAGLPTGAALVFLMAGPATNVATLGAVYRTLGGRLLAIYLATILVGSIGGGLLFGWLIDPTAATVIDHEHGAPWWAAASAIVLLALFAWFALDDVRKLFRKPVEGDEAPTLTLGVDGMTCQGCVAKLEKTLAADPAIASARVTLSPGEAVIRGDVSPDRARELVRQTGFTPR